MRPVKDLRVLHANSNYKTTLVTSHALEIAYSDENMGGAFCSPRGKAETKAMGLNPAILNYWGTRQWEVLIRVRQG